jgi:hypothetical protein
MAKHREVGTIELQDEARVDDRLVFALHHIGERIHIRLFGFMVLVLEIGDFSCWPDFCRVLSQATA